MKVKAVDIVKKHKNIEYVSPDKGLAWADLVFVCLPLTDKTKGMFSYSQFKKMNKGSFLVNVGRGETTPIQDLTRAMDEKILEGVGLDVYEEENVIGDLLRAKMVQDVRVKRLLKFAKRENVLCTPHNAFNSLEAVERKSKLAVDSFKQLQKNKKFIWEIK
ncbi:MAG: hypothetical protein HQL25_03515 [Candidatus Omnitrophica bacterium]|nr:hypothetical protein [Candidatus Omnitrophota bacterium]